ncbi:glycosyltransferase family 2 protein [Polynucleobacter sp. MWH-Aus1W21]|uniref:glycosyltransferase n=1 Tax=Polynucleobacter sp. MWH-Aus1W21 TaxID=1855880 RepID=UPI001BFDA7C3|nr:glycosyltransferase [Polynucleobacter sp. MWH-Aus1W21]QWD67151.1 glycosyltransferase family 2 protein [Polynucleobacter sp. MWH-Aus1W21]
MAVYITVHTKFVIASIVGLAWGSFSIWYSQPWFLDLSVHVGPFLAFFLITFIAIIPGCMNAFVFTSLLLDKRPPVIEDQKNPEVTILIAAFNEGMAIDSTLEGIRKQNYLGPMRVIVVDDGSTDNTSDVVRSKQATNPNIELISLTKNGGKAAALNQGLKISKSAIVISVDADSYLHVDAIKNLVGRFISDPLNTKAVAGEILIRNSRTNWITKAQEWDYFLGIASIKRIQSLFQGTLVAQGAFSLYDRNALNEVGGWPGMVGEDIVLTWKLLLAGYRVGHAEDAIAFTNCPETLKAFIKQRQRWSRGLIESFKVNPMILLKPRLSTIYIWWNTMFPFMDIAYSLGFIPGLVLACFGYFWIVGPMTLSILPMALALNLYMYSRSQSMFSKEHLKVRANIFGFLFYVFAYGLILQPACVYGYFSELFNLNKTWGTK